MKSLFKRLFSKEPDITGVWSTTHNDDGLSMIFGSVLTLNKNGTGTLNSWGHGYDEPYDFLDDVEWKITGNGMVEIKYVKDEKFTAVNYMINKITGTYNIKYYELYEPFYRLAGQNAKGLWNIPDSMIKPMR